MVGYAASLSIFGLELYLSGRPLQHPIGVTISHDSGSWESRFPLADAFAVEEERRVGVSELGDEMADAQGLVVFNETLHRCALGIGQARNQVFNVARRIQ